jgi:hypothetical protein
MACVAGLGEPAECRDGGQDDLAVGFRQFGDELVEQAGLAPAGVFERVAAPLGQAE